MFYVSFSLITINYQKSQNITNPDFYLVAMYKDVFVYLPKSIWTAVICEVTHPHKLMLTNKTSYLDFQKHFRPFRDFSKSAHSSY